MEEQTWKRNRSSFSGGYNLSNASCNNCKQWQDRTHKIELQISHSSNSNAQEKNAQWDLDIPTANCGNDTLIGKLEIIVTACIFTATDRALLLTSPWQKTWLVCLLNIHKSNGHTSDQRKHPSCSLLFTYWSFCFQEQDA